MTPHSIVPPLDTIRTCDEHRSRILRMQGFWAIHRAKTLRLKVHLETNKRKNPSPDYRGRPRIWNQQLFLLDENYPKNHERYKVLRAHCFRLANGEIGASGLFDPKHIIVGNRIYTEMLPDNPRCDLCELGDTIPLGERRYGASYSPGTRVNLFVHLCHRIKKWFLHRYDRWDQRTIRRQTVPK